MEEDGLQQAVQKMSEANMRDAEKRHLISTSSVENTTSDQVPADVPAAAELPAQASVTESPANALASDRSAMLSPVLLPAASPLAAATPFDAAGPAPHHGKAPLRPKSLAAISDQPATHHLEEDAEALDEASAAALPATQAAIVATDQVFADARTATLTPPPAAAAAELLTVGASPSVRDEDRVAPLHLAAMPGHVEVTLPAQASVTASPPVVAIRTAESPANALASDRSAMLSPVLLPAASPLAAATPFDAAGPAPHHGKAPLRPKSLAAISDQPATHHPAVPAASEDVGQEATAHEAEEGARPPALMPTAESATWVGEAGPASAACIPAGSATHQASPQAEDTAAMVTVAAQQATAAADHAAQQAAALNAWLTQNSAYAACATAPQLAASDGTILDRLVGVAASPPMATAAVEHGAAPVLKPAAIRKQPPQDSPLPPGHFKRPRGGSSSGNTWDPTRASGEWRRSPLSLTPGTPAAPITPAAPPPATTTAADALGGIARPWQSLEVEPMFSMQHLLTQQGMTLSDPPPMLPSPRASWQLPSLDVGLRLSAEEFADEPRTSPALLAMGDAAPLDPTCVRGPNVSGVTSRWPSASHSTSPPQSFGLFSNGRQPGVQLASRGSPSAMQPLHTEPNADVGARTGARGGPLAAAACTASARTEAAATDAASLPSPGVLHAPTVVKARVQQGFVLEPDGILVSARPRPSPVTEQQPRMPNGKRSALAGSLNAGAWGGSEGDAVDGLGHARRQQRRAAAAVDDGGPQRGVASASASVRDAGSSGSGSTQLLHDLDDLASMEDAQRLRGGGDTALGTADGAAPDDEQVTFEAAMEEEVTEEEAAEKEAAEEEAAVDARPAEGVMVEMDDEREIGAAEDEASETDEMEELPEEVKEVEEVEEVAEVEEVEEMAEVEQVEEPSEEARATGAEQMGLEPASWDDTEVELEPENGHGNPRPVDRNTLATRCGHSPAWPPAAFVPPPAAPVRARGGRCIQEYFEHEGLYKLMTRSARRRADLVSAIHAVQVLSHRLTALARVTRAAARCLELTSLLLRLPWQRLLETAPLQCNLTVLDECAAATAKMVQAATPLPPLPPAAPLLPAQVARRFRVPARAFAAPTTEACAVEALVAAARFACLRFVQRRPVDGGSQWLRLSGLLELIAPPASASAGPTHTLGAKLGDVRTELVGILRRPRGEFATQAGAVPRLDDYEARRKELGAALGAAAERWTPPTRCRGGDDSALPPPLPVLSRVI